MSECVFELNGVNGQLKIYEDKVVIERKGALGFLTQGLAGGKTIPIAAIQSVQFKEGSAFINGFIQFGIMGGREKQGGVFNATQDENTVMIAMKDNCSAREIKNYIEEKILEMSKPRTTVVQQPSSAADEIRKLKDLLDCGILTQEEFDAKKKQLLGI